MTMLILLISHFITIVIIKTKQIISEKKSQITITESFDFINAHFVNFLFYSYCNYKKQIGNLWKKYHKSRFTITESLDFDNAHFVNFLFYYYHN